MSKHWKILFFIMLCVLSAPVVGSDMNEEIAYLLNLIEKTECQYERNGKIYSGKKAARHVQKKYNYFKDEIDNTEKFIELSATKSTMSGKYYLIHCNGAKTKKMQVWLLRELESFRSNSSIKTRFQYL